MSLGGLFDAVDLFAGPGGWTEALRALGLRDLGIELDDAACATRYAGGHATWQADVTSITTATIRRLFRGVRGFIASPPCPKFSDAGDGEGRAHIPALCAAIHAGDWSARPSDDPMIWMALEVGRWVEAMEPEWIALEQVPGALPLWEAYAVWLRAQGYSVWCGVLCAADFGVPQTRRRAVLMASKTVAVQPPTPTHCDGGAVSLFGELEPWVSLAEGLGWVGENVDQPARTLCGDRSPRWMYPDGDGSRGRMVVLDRRQQNADGSPVPPVPPVPPERPSPTLTAQAGKGQIGNAIPPLLARHIVAAAHVIHWLANRYPRRAVHTVSCAVWETPEPAGQLELALTGNHDATPEVPVG